jgi:hypothetical protein
MLEAALCIGVDFCLWLRRDGSYENYELTRTV